MGVVETTSREATVTFSERELSIINNALNESLETIDPEEFHARMGTTDDEVSALLRQIKRVLREMRR